MARPRDKGSPQNRQWKMAFRQSRWFDLDVSAVAGLDAPWGHGPQRPLVYWGPCKRAVRQRFRQLLDIFLALLTDSCRMSVHGWRAAVRKSGSI
jgi:hypothetical protein